MRAGAGRIYNVKNHRAGLTGPEGELSLVYRVLAVGDTVGATGLDYLDKNLRRIKRELGADFIVVNGENANVVGPRPSSWTPYWPRGRTR